MRTEYSNPGGRCIVDAGIQFMRNYSQVQSIPPRPLTAAILAGGKSSRMGQDKALLRLDSDEPCLLELTIARALRTAGGVFIVSSRGQAYEQFGVKIVPDAFPGGGVLGGIATALLNANGNDVLVLACDHPFLNVNFLRAMASLPRTYDALVPRTKGASRQGGDHVLQTLLAIYRPASLPVLKRLLADGYESSMSFFRQVEVQTIEEDVLRSIDPELMSFFSANTPELLDEARRIHRERGKAGAFLGYTEESN